MHADGLGDKMEPRRASVLPSLPQLARSSSLDTQFDTPSQLVRGSSLDTQLLQSILQQVSHSNKVLDELDKRVQRLEEVNLPLK